MTSVTTPQRPLSARQAMCRDGLLTPRDSDLLSAEEEVNTAEEEVSTQLQRRRSYTRSLKVSLLQAREHHLAIANSLATHLPGATSTELHNMALTAKVVRAARYQVLFREHQPVFSSPSGGGALFVIIEGEVSLRWDANDLSVQRLGPGRCFGLEALAEERKKSRRPRKRAATAVVSRGGAHGREALLARLELVVPTEEGGVARVAGLPRRPSSLNNNPARPAEPTRREEQAASNLARGVFECYAMARLKRAPLLGAALPEHVLQLTRLMRVREMHAGAQLLEPGTLPDAIFALLSGTVLVRSGPAMAERVCSATDAETTLLGEVVLVSRDARAAEHAASAVCAGPCVLLALLERDYAKVPWLRARVAALLKQQRASPTRRMQRMHTQVRQQSAQSLTDAGPALDAFTVTNIT